MLVLYRILFIILLPFIGLRLLWKGRKDIRYRYHIAERFGKPIDTVGAGVIWVHAVSVGEVIAASTIVDRYLNMDSNITILMTTMTPTGRQQVMQCYGQNPRVHVSYVPYDVRFALRRFLAYYQPRICVIMETELWPILIDEVHRQNIPILLANARLSRYSCRQYARFYYFFSRTLGKITHIAAQYATDARRFRFLLSNHSTQVSVVGSVKYDRIAPVESARMLPHVWAAVSTHPGEEAVLIEAFTILRHAHPDTILLLAPRHVERAGALHTYVRSVLGEEGVSLYSQLPDDQYGSDVVIVDKMGVLSCCFQQASVVFVGGSLVDRGGQNPIEPAAYGLPLLMGPSRYNFHTITHEMAHAGILTKVTNSQDIAACLTVFRLDRQAAQAIGKKARQFVAIRGGAADQHVVFIQQLVEESQ